MKIFENTKLTYPKLWRTLVDLFFFTSQDFHVHLKTYYRETLQRTINLDYTFYINTAEVASLSYYIGIFSFFSKGHRVKKTIAIVPSPRPTLRLWSDREGRACQTTRSDCHRIRRLHEGGKALCRWRTWKNRGKVLHDDHMIIRSLRSKYECWKDFSNLKHVRRMKITTCKANLFPRTSVSIAQYRKKRWLWNIKLISVPKLFINYVFGWEVFKLPLVPFSSVPWSQNNERNTSF